MISKKKISNEYSQNLQKYIKKEYERKNERHLLGYFLSPDNRKSVSVSVNDDLMNAITKIIPEGKGADRFFVYVAFKKGRVLVTNDRRDIIDERGQIGERKRKLFKNTKKYRSDGKSDILTSQAAYDKL